MTEIKQILNIKFDGYNFKYNQDAKPCEYDEWYFETENKNIVKLYVGNLMKEFKHIDTTETLFDLIYCKKTMYYYENRIVRYLIGNPVSGKWLKLECDQSYEITPMKYHNELIKYIKYQDRIIENQKIKTHQNQMNNKLDKIIAIYEHELINRIKIESEMQDIANKKRKIDIEDIEDIEDINNNKRLKIDLKDINN